MANWDAITVKVTVNRIRDESLVLPVSNDGSSGTKIKWNCCSTPSFGRIFGGIMSIEEEKDAQPIFAFREFSRTAF